LQQLFAEQFPKHNTLLAVEKENGVTLNPTHTKFKPNDVVVFREFRPTDRDVHRLFGRRRSSFEMDYTESLPKRLHYYAIK
jgi:hypothetical protein